MPDQLLSGHISGCIGFEQKVCFIPFIGAILFLTLLIVVGLNILRLTSTIITVIVNLNFWLPQDLNSQSDMIGFLKLAILHSRVFSYTTYTT